jgi:DNA-directed RNA polymerase subunit RPC12/RpoP
MDEANTERRHRCPDCGSYDIRRDHRRGILERWALTLFGTRPYQCIECGHRFWDSPLGDGRSYTD